MIPRQLRLARGLTSPRLRSHLLLVMWVLLLVFCVSCGSSDDTALSLETIAKVKVLRLSETNIEESSFKAVRPDAKPGDYLISNDRVAAVIDQVATDPVHGVALQNHRAPTGGTLIDMGVLGGADQLLQIQTIVNFDPNLPAFHRTLRIGDDGVSLVAEGGVLDPGFKLGLETDSEGVVAGVALRTTYRTADSRPWIEIETEITNTSSRDLPVNQVADLVLVDGRSLRTFVPSPGWGSRIADQGSTTAPWVVFSGESSPGSSYAIIAPEQQAIDVQPFTESDHRVRMIAVGSPVFGSTFLGVGETRTWRRLILTDDSTDPAGITELLLSVYAEIPGSEVVALGFRHMGTLQARLDPPVSAEVTFNRLDPDTYLGSTGVLEGAVLPISGLRLSEGDGAIETSLPLGDYEIVVEAYGYGRSSFPVTIAESGTDAGVLTLQGAGTSPLTVHLLNELKEPFTEPVRLSVLGLGGTEDPSFDQLLTSESVVGAGRCLWTDTGSLSLELVQGSYRLIASRGPAYDAVFADLRVPLVETLELVLDPLPMETGGYLSMDPVTGTELSYLGAHSISDLSLAVLAEGIDFYGRTEAQRESEWIATRPDQLGASGILGTLDLPRYDSPEGDGWFAALPVNELLTGPGLGPPVWIEEAESAGALLTVMLAPRCRSVSGVGLGYLEAHDFYRLGGLQDPANEFLWETSDSGLRALDVDTIEILSPRDPWHTSLVLQDWYVFLDAGFPMHPAASSTAFDLSMDHLGAARMMVRGDKPDSDALLQAAAAGRSYVTSGPLIELEVREGDAVALPGDTLEITSDRVLVNVKVRASNFVPCSNAQLIMNGNTVQRWNIEGSEELRLEESIWLPVEPDSAWLVLEVGDPDLVPDGLFSQIYPDMPSVAISAPVRIVRPAE